MDNPDYELPDDDEPNVEEPAERLFAFLREPGSLPVFHQPMSDEYIVYFWLAYLGPYEFLVWAVLAGIYDDIAGDPDRRWPTVSWLANRFGIRDDDAAGQRQFRSAIERLAGHGLLSYQSDPDKAGRFIYATHKPRLLSPQQVRQLPPTIQQSHARYVARRMKPEEVEAWGNWDGRRESD